MARRKTPDEVFTSFLGEPRPANTERTQSEHRENTERTRPADYSKFTQSELETFSIRLSPGDRQRLRDHFKRRGVPLSQGIRQVLIDYIEQEGL